MDPKSDDIERPLLDLAKALDLAVTAYSSLGPQSFYEIGGSKDATSLLESKTITKVAKRAEKSTSLRFPPTQLQDLTFSIRSSCSGTASMGVSYPRQDAERTLNRRSTQRGISVIPKSSHVSHDETC